MLFFFSPALMSGGDQKDAKPDKIWYLKEGNVQYFYFKEGKEWCHFRLEVPESNLPGPDADNKTLEENVVLEFKLPPSANAGGNGQGAGTVAKVVTLRKQGDKFILKPGDQMNLNVDQVLEALEKALKKAAEKDSKKEFLVSWKVDPAFNKKELDKIKVTQEDLKGQLEQLVKHFNAPRKENKVSPFPDNIQKNYKDIYDKINQGKEGENQDFNYWKKKFFDIKLVDFHKELLSKDLESLAPGSLLSAYIFPAVKIVLPLLVVLLGLFWSYWKIKNNNRNEIKAIEKRLDFPTSLAQVPGYIDKLTEQIEKECEKNANNTLNSLKEKLGKFLDLEKDLYNITIDKISRSKDDIVAFTQNTFGKRNSIVNESYPLYWEFKEIFGFVEKRMQDKAIELINHCQLNQKIDFIENRSFKPGGIADAIVLFRKSLTNMNDHMAQALQSEKFSSPAAQEETYKYTSSSKQLIENFYKDCEAISTMDTAFKDQINRLQKAFKDLKTGYDNFLKENSLINGAQAVQTILTPGLAKLEQSLKYLEENHSEFGKIFREFNEISGKLNDCQNELRKELEKAQQTSIQMADGIKEQNTSGNKLLKDFEGHVTQLKTNLENLGTYSQQFGNAAEKLTEQNGELETKVSNFDDPLNKLNQKIKSLKEQLDRLDGNIKTIAQTASDLKGDRKTMGDNIITFSGLNTGLETSAKQINTSTTTLSENLTTFNEHNQTFEGKIGELEQQRAQWSRILSEIRLQLEDLKEKLSNLKIETDRLTAGNNKSIEIIGSMQSFKELLEEEAKKINQYSDFFIKNREEAHNSLADLTTKTLAISGDVITIQKIHRDIKKQTDEVKGFIRQVNVTITQLNDQVQAAAAISSQLAKQGAANKISSESIMETSHGLTEQMEKMQGVLKDIEALKKEIDQVEGTARTLDETSGRFENYEKELLTQVASVNPEIKLARDLFNNELKLNLTEKNSFAILRKLQGEIIESIEYRNYAINLLKDFRLVEKNHTEQWYWKLLKPVRDGLEAHKEALFRHKGQTIYDGVYNYNANTPETAPITKDHLKIVINEQHWGQIWEPLIKACQFFEVYSRDEYLEVLQLLGMSAKKIMNLLEKHLNYRIDRYLPLQQVPTQKIEAGEVQEALNHFMFYQDILPHLRNNQRFIDVENRYTPNGNDSVIVFVDTLGLVDNGKRIRTPKVVLYSPMAIKNSR